MSARPRVPRRADRPGRARPCPTPHSPVRYERVRPRRGRSAVKALFWKAESRAVQFVSIFTDLDVLGRFLFCPFTPRHSGKGDGGFVAGDHARARPAEGDRLVVTAL